MSALRALRFVRALALPAGVLALAPAAAHAQRVRCPASEPTSRSECPATPRRLRCSYRSGSNQQRLVECACGPHDPHSAATRWRCAARWVPSYEVGPLPPPELAA